MEKLLRESEFANTWNKSIPGYIMINTGDSCRKSIYKHKDRIKCLVAVVHLKNSLPCYLKIYNACSSFLGNNVLNDFISDYKIEPYTYVFSVQYVDNVDFFASQNLKPFSWLVKCDIPESELSKLPICVVSSNEC